MGERVSAAAKGRSAASPDRARHDAARVFSEPGDAHEREADRVADAALTGSAGAPAISLGSIPLLQREEKPPGQKSEEEKYKEAAQKAGEAFLKTAPGREIEEKAKELGESFVSTLPGKVITGAAVAGAVTTLAVTHRELPVGIPEIPLDRIRPGLKMKITYEGPVDRPTKVMATFSLPLGGGGEKKPAVSKSEAYRAETARLAREQEAFREGLKTPDERDRERRMLEAWMSSRRGALAGSPLSFGAPAAPVGLGPPLPLTGEASVPGASRPEPRAFTLTGETQEKPKEAEARKKPDEPTVQRKAAAPGGPSTVPPIVGETLRTSGQPLDAGTRARMESRLGVDLGRVRIHADAQATRSAEAVEALAYTVGDDVVFGSGQYSPQTADGQRLLAHELAHVVQQGGGARSPALTPAPPRIARKKSAKAPEPRPLEVALKGDDDAVRALTNHSDWEFMVVRPEEAATLLIHLLDGATGGDDERTGLKILGKAVHQLLLDRALEILTERGRFEQLLDDYHGAEYRALLKLLSENIQTKAVTAVYLDAFIAMWWVREHEETAIVVLLERTSKSDQLELLMAKDRLGELRSAIDNDDPRRRYEAVVAGVNEERGEQLKTRVSAILEIDAKASVRKGQRTEAEVKKLLESAAEDVANELLDYQRRLAEAIGSPKADPAAITKINQEFEKRLNGLLALKKAEFGLELRYNIEFNRLLNSAYGRPWTEADLQEFDRIMSRIPDDLLRGNPKFEAFLRGTEHPKLAGQSSSSTGRVTLYGSLDLDTTLHELGHQFHDTDEHGITHEDPFEVPVFREFAALSEWTRLTRDDIVLQARDDNERKKLSELTDQLDAHRAKDDRDARVERGGYFYRYNRYPGSAPAPAGGGPSPPTYYRYRKGSLFAGAYAMTDPQDDFAETFSRYLTSPEWLQEQLPVKYEFMHVRVFARERLLRQANRVLERFDARVAEALSFAAPEFAEALRLAHVIPLRVDLDHAMRRQRIRAEREARRTVADKPKPIPATAVAEQLAKPFFDRLEVLLALLERAVIAVHRVKFQLDMQQIFGAVDPDLTGTHGPLGDELVTRCRTDVLALATAPARRAASGQAVDAGSWPELDALEAKYEKAIKVVPPYLPILREAHGLQYKFAEFAGDVNRRFKTSKKRQDIVKHLLTLRKDVLLPEVEAWKAGVIDRILNGTPFDRKQVTEPATILKRVQKQAEADVVRIAAGRRAVNDGQPTGKPEAVQGAVDSPGQPLDSGTRGLMESRFGQDFGGVRVHTGAEAAAGAKALNAEAFTVGQDVVFADSAFQPGTEQGQRLMAHELTHVVQQEGATGVPVPEERRDQTPPPLSFEELDLPQSEEANEDAPRAIAPVASAPEGAGTPPAGPIGTAPADGEGGVAAAPADGGPASPLVVPPSHPSEQEAERVSRTLFAPDTDRWPPGVPVTQRTRRARIQRQRAQQQDQPRGIDVVFIMGVDRNPRRNPFYREAVKYFKAAMPNAALVNDDKHRSLESVFDYLRDRGELVANLYLVSHANEDGTLSFKLRQSDRNADPHVQYGDLTTALSKEAGLFQLPKGVIDRNTRISVKGCNIGRSTRMLDALDQAFGGEGTVVAPTHKQVFGTKSVGRGAGRKVERYEALDVYYIEYKGNQRISPADQQAAFIAKYSELPEAQWQKWVPVDRRGRGGAPRRLISIPYTFRYRVNVKSKESRRTAEQEALPEAVAWGEKNIGRADMFEWRIASTAPTGDGWLVTAVAEKTNYVVDRILVGAAGKRLQPPETDPKYFGVSTYGDDAKKAAAGGARDTAALMAELAGLAKALPDAPEGPERDEKLGRKREIETMLASRSATVDVNVVKTEDWLGADEVYVAVSGGSRAFKSPVKKLNDGQSDAYTVPLTALMPFDKPVKLEVFDEDLGWFFDRDDLIVTMDWPPPFEETTSKESLDEADYRVRAHL